MAAPVKAPPASMSIVIASPIAIPPRAGPRESTAVPNITNTRKKVSMASMATPAAKEICESSSGVPNEEVISSKLAGNSKFIAIAPIIPPSS